MNPPSVFELDPKDPAPPYPPSPKYTGPITVAETGNNPAPSLPPSGPCGWSRITKWRVGALVVMALIVAVVVGAVVGVRNRNNNRYPKYSKLNYTLVDTYEGPSFFDNFDFFSGEDPTYGFVQYVDKTQNVFSTWTDHMLPAQICEPRGGTGLEPDPCHGLFRHPQSRHVQHQRGKWTTIGPD